MSIEPVANTDLEYYLIAFDSEGKERKDDKDGLMSVRALEALKNNSYTDVFLLSHGWRGDIAAARDQYSRWIGAMAQCTNDRVLMEQKRPNFLPLIIGLHWPSEPWGNETLARAAFVGAAIVDHVEERVSEIAPKVVDTPASRSALRLIISADMEESNPPHMPREVRDAYDVLNREIGLGENGVSAAPGQDREPFNAEAMYQTNQSTAQGFGGAAEGMLSLLRSFSFYKMKDRARRFGESGANLILSELLREGTDRGVRFHLMGHSFGCIVVSAALVGPSGSTLPAQVNSLALIQGALSLWSYCSNIPKASGSPGYFHRLVSEQRVIGPIITTQSTRDTAVGTWYPRAAGAAHQLYYMPAVPLAEHLAYDNLPKYGGVGYFGIQGPGVDCENRCILQTDKPYGFVPGKIYNIESSGVIKDGSGLSGAHSDICKPEVAHAVWEAAMIS